MLARVKHLETEELLYRCQET